MVLKDSIEEMFLKWPGEPDDPQLVSLITYIHAGRFQKKVKTHNEVNNIEGKAAATGKGSSKEEGYRYLENKATLTTIVSTLENISRKFDQIDSRFDAYELERNRPLMDQKTIDDMVKALVEERLKVLGKISENNDNLSNGGEEETLSLPSPQQNTQ
ncbi:unnamed protein product [Brassica rapa subsp. trilocularis]